MASRYHEEILSELSSILELSSTEKEILALLLKTEEKLRIDDVVDRIERSERAIRGRMKSLHDINLVRRESITTENGQKAYRYFAPPVSNLIRRAKREITFRLHELENRIEEMRG